MTHPKGTHHSARPSPAASAAPSATPVRTAEGAHVSPAPATPVEAAAMTAAVPSAPRERGTGSDSGQDK